MGPHVRSPRIEELLAHADWVRQVARDLVRDEQRADDVVQETWVAALESPPSDSSNLRAWLAAVARNAARGLGRSEKRRTAREEAAARAEALESTAEVAGRAALQRDLVDRVLSLDEPYRAVLLLRYFEELEPREIAKRLAIPVATVRTRHARGLDRLRAKLEREYGDRRAWTLALAPIAAGGRPSTAGGGGSATAAIGGVLAMTKTKTLLVALVLLALGTVVWRGLGNELPPAARDEPTVASNTPSAPEPAREPPASASTDRVVLGATEALEPAAGSVPRATISALVVDHEGRPQAGVEFKAAPARLRFATLEEWEHSSTLGEEREREAAQRELARLTASLDRVPTLTSEPDGRLAIDPGSIELLHVWQRGRVLVGGGWRNLPVGGEELVLIVAPTATLTGTTVDERGEPVAKASVRATAWIDAIETLPWTLQRTFGRGSGSHATSGPDGHFVLAGAALIPQLGLGAVAESSRSRMHEPFAGGVSPGPIELVLVADAAEFELAVTGRVATERGAPAADVEVRLAQWETLSASDGTFRLSLGKYESEEQALRSVAVTSKAHALVALRPGMQAAVLEDFSTRLEDPGAREGVLLQLGPEALAIAGQVVDARGAPLAGLVIQLLDPTFLGISSQNVEDRSRTRNASGSAERGIRTKADGSFLIGGLLARSYRLLAVGLESRVVVESDPIEAGSTGVVLRAPADGVIEKVDGRVRTRSGVPVAGIEVGLDLGWQSEWGVVFRRRAQQAITDREGRFTLNGVPKRRASVSVGGTNVPWTMIDTSEIVPGTELEIVVAALVRLQVEPRTGDPASTFEIHDEGGKPLRITVLRKDGASYLYIRAPLRPRDGGPGRSSGVCQVGEEARTLVLYEGDTELRRVPLELSTDEVRIVTP